MDKTYLYLNALRSDFCTNLSLNGDVSENTLPFVSQSINNFSDYDIKQSHDWKCPSLSPHVLLGKKKIAKTMMIMSLQLQERDTNNFV